MTLWSMVTEKTASDHSAQITTSSFTVLKSQLLGASVFHLYNDRFKAS